MKKIIFILPLFLISCVDDEFQEIHTVSFNGQPQIVETTSGRYRNTGNIAIRGNFGGGSNSGSIYYGNRRNYPPHNYRSYPSSEYVEYSDGNTTITRGRYVPNCEKLIHRRGRSYLVPCDY